MASWSARIHHNIAVLTFTRAPDNQLDLPSLEELATHLESLADRRAEVSVIMLASGLDGIFIKHADPSILRRAAGGWAPPSEEGVWQRCLDLLASVPQPTVAAVDGRAWGSGLETALACTLRIASDRSHFSQPEIRYGVIPNGGGTQRLPRLIGSGRAAEMILTGRVVQAEEAHRLGIVNAVLPTAGFKQQAIDWCAALVRHPVAALVAAKQAVHDGAGMPLADGLALECALFKEVVGSSAFAPR
ncbi:enoyl-CoA hydratase/isomerase family protein [Streptomyces sp. NPDC098789]|uniref:enoyl-CoA hydratase/isomerase family protein n=1 Tax=Streptomyces sp. NPDC098789 TaxID=3366098 RepID=UPI00381DEE73